MGRNEVIRKDLKLETCGQSDHKSGCYIRFSDEQCEYSEDNLLVIANKDKNGKIVGLEFPVGLNEKPQRIKENKKNGQK